MKTTDDEIDRALAIPALRPPEHFSTRVMAAATQAIRPIEEPKLHKEFLKWIAIGTGGAIGITQSISFIFGIWFATTVA